MNFVLLVLRAILFERNQFAIFRSSSLTNDVNSLRMKPFAKHVVSSAKSTENKLVVSLPFFCARSRVLLVHLAGGWGGTITEGNAAKNDVVFTYFSCMVLFYQCFINLNFYVNGAKYAIGKVTVLNR
jgi:hypothetical protein